MAARRHYTDQQRERIYRMSRRGYTSTEIARACEKGLEGIEPFKIPERTVRSIVQAMARENAERPTLTPIPSRASSCSERRNCSGKRPRFAGWPTRAAPLGRFSISA